MACATLKPFDKYFMLNFNDLVKPEKDIKHELLRRLWRCEWQTDPFERIIAAWTKQRIIVDDDDSLQKLLCAALEMTCIFIQVNFTGPTLPELDVYKQILENNTQNQYDPYKRLMESSEEINSNVELGELLVIAKEMLEMLLKKLPTSIVINWWLLRLLCIHQSLLSELAGTIKQQIVPLLDFLLANSCVLDDYELETLLHIECANAYLQFRATESAGVVLRKLREKLKVSFSTEGLMGMRTRFQQKPLPQLCLRVLQEEPQRLPNASATNGSIMLPKLMLHQDDTRLERILFVDEADNKIMELPAILQVLVLATTNHLKRAQAKDKLTDELFMPYVQTLIYQGNGPLFVRLNTLLLNCMLESDQRRTVERSWKQCEEVIRIISDPNFKLPIRLSYAFASGLKPSWEIEQQHCKLLLLLGMIKSALDIYLRLKQWEEVIFCYTRLEMRQKAKEYIEQELAKRPTVLLYILLGEVTDKPEYYEQAWKFSGERSARAQAYWGHYYFKRGEYENAVEHYNKSVELNTLQELVWSRLGFAAMKTSKWDLAVRAYINYTHLEPLGFESWNNLAKALIKLDDKERAHKMLTEAIKCNYDSWKIWENFLAVSLDTQHFDDALNAYIRLTELKDRFIDLEAMCFIVNAILVGKKDASGETTNERLKKKTISVIAHECVRHMDEPKLWELNAMLAPTPLNKAQKWLKALNALTVREHSWASMQPFALRALKISYEICVCSIDAINNHTEDESILMINAQLNSARLAVGACIRALEKNPEKFEENETHLKDLKTIYEELLKAIEARKSI